MKLTDFADANPPKPGYKAWLDTLPDDQAAEILNAYKAGVSITVIRRWLVEDRGHDTTAVPKNEAVRRWLADHATKGTA